MRRSVDCTRQPGHAGGTEYSEEASRRNNTRGTAIIFGAGVAVALAGSVLVGAWDREEPSNLVGITEDTPPLEMPGVECMQEERAAGNIVEGSTSDAVRAAELCIGTMIDGRRPDPTEVQILAGIFSNPDQP